MKIRLLATVAAALSAVGLQAEMLRFSAFLSGSKEVPVATTSATGRAEVWFDTETKAYTAYVTIAGLSGSLTMSHIHEGAAGTNGPVVANFGGPSAYAAGANGFYAGKFTGVYGGDVGKLLAAGAYVNIHSTTFPGGEVRGQLVREDTARDALVNVSSRGALAAGGGREGTLIAGFVIDRESRVLIRSLGESLKDFGVSNNLADTGIDLFDSSNMKIASNDNWKSSQRWNVTATPFAPMKDSDSAIVRTLSPGAYTVQVQSEKGAGVAIAEVYTLPKDSMVGMLSKIGQFNTLIAAAQAAGLVDALMGPGPFTLFAPTDAAFAKLPAGTVETLLLPENKGALAGILLYHLIPAKVMSTQLSNGLKAATVQGSQVTFTLTGGAKIDNANIIEVDLDGSNGVIHIIDSVILPPST